MFIQFGPDPGLESGGIINRDCRDVKCPADDKDPNCKGGGWKYTTGKNWELDNTISLKCVDGT